MAWYIYKGSTFVPGYGTVANWTKIKNIYRKTTPSVYALFSATNFTDASKEWRRHSAIYYKTPTTWRKVFTKTSTGVRFTTGPAIHVYSSPFPYGPNDGISVTGPKYINDVLYGKDGIWTPRNETSIARSFQAATTPDGAIRFTIDDNDVFDLSSRPDNQEQADESYLYYKISVQNYGDLVTSTAGPVKLIKREASFNSWNVTGTATVGSTLTGTYSLENRWYNKPELYNSYIRWWRSSTNDPSGVMVREEYLGDHYSTNSSTTLSGSDTYTVQAGDAGYYIVFQVVPVNSYNRHYGYETYASSPSNIISSPITISQVNFTDVNGRSGKNARGNLVTATTTTLNWTVGGVNANTTFRVRYRVKNNQNGLYYNPNDPNTALAAGSAWQSYTDNYNGTGDISGISISGSTATLFDTFEIDSTFNGSTYAISGTGGFARWSFEYELSVVNSSGTRYYWVYPNSVSTTQAHDYWDIDPTTNPSISASPSTIAPGGTVTFSGTFNSYPASLSSYPHSYRIVYGTSPATDSGWITLGSGTANQTYTNTKVYDTTGSYLAYVETTPYYTYNSASVTVANQLTAPVLDSVTPGPQGGLVQANFSGGSGPHYQMFWWGTASAPTSSVTPDGNRQFSPVQDFTGPNSTSTYYMYVRSVLTAGETSLGPSSLASAWSNGKPFNMTSTAVVQNSAPTATATSTGSTTTVKYLDSITWSSGTYTNQASKTSVLLYSTSSPNSDTSTAFKTANPYIIQPSDPAGLPYIFVVRDTVVGTNGTTYYFYSNQITSAKADAVTFSYNPGVGAAGGWSATVVTAQSGQGYSIPTTTGYSVNSSSGTVTATGLGSNVSSSITVTKSVPGYNDTTAPASGTSATVITYSLNYSANGGSSTPSAQTGASGSTITLASSAGTKSGFTFGGWNIGGTTYSAGGSYTFGSADAAATAIWNAAFVAPTSPAPSWSSGSNFQRITGSSILRWYTDYPSISGDGSITGMQFQIRTTAGGGTLLADSTRSYPGAGSYPYSGGGTIWAFRCGTSDGDISYSSSARYARARVVMLGTNGTTYYGTYSGWI